jgi:hypothetical protein
VQAGESYLGCHIHVNALVSTLWFSNASLSGHDVRGHGPGPVHEV